MSEATMKTEPLMSERGRVARGVSGRPGWDLHGTSVSLRR